MHISNLYLVSCFILGAVGVPAGMCGGGDDIPPFPSLNASPPPAQNTSPPPTQNTSPPAVQNASPPPAQNTAPSPAQNGTANGAPSGAPSIGTKYQATVTGYGVCLTQGMACGLTGSPGKDPTAAMSAYLIPTYGKGTCGSCWKLSNPRGLNYHGEGTIPTIAGPLNSPQGDGMVVLINNACAPGGNQYGPGQIGQCTQNSTHPTDKLGSQTVLDLCSETNAVQMFWGTPNPGLAVADIEEVDCSQWTGHSSPAH